MYLLASFIASSPYLLHSCSIVSPYFPCVYGTLHGETMEQLWSKYVLSRVRTLIGGGPVFANTKQMYDKNSEYNVRIGEKHR